MNLLTTKQQVEKILGDYPAARNSDITLTIEIWKRFYPEKVSNGTVALSALYDLPREDSVKRIRAKFQQEAMERIEAGRPGKDDWIYLPSDPKIAEQRGIMAAQWQKALGYWNWIGAPKQTTQLPRPVGGISYHFVKINQNGNYYLATGALGKSYEVLIAANNYGVCQCEAYRFSSKKSCKHIEIIVKDLKLKQQAEAAQKQPQIF